jgi:hypothetical protein
MGGAALLAAGLVTDHDAGGELGLCAVYNEIPTWVHKVEMVSQECIAVSTPFYVFKPRQ